MKRESIFRAIAVAGLLLLGAGCAGPAGTGAGHNPAQSEFLSTTLWFFVIGMFGYFLLVTRPMAMKEEAQKKFLEGLKKGDEVMTSGGIFGRVVSTSADLIGIEIAQGVRIRVKPEHVQATPAPAAKNAAKEGGEKNKGGE